MLKEIRRMSPLRAGLVYGALIGLVYLVTGVAMLLFGGLVGVERMMEMGGPGGPFAPGAEHGPGPGGAGMMAVGGVFGVLVGSLIGAVVGFVFGILVAVVYNLVAGLTGGLLVELADPGSSQRSSDS